MEIEKRKKRVMFSDEERVRLAEMIEVHKSVIESKKCDSVSNLEKNKAWEDITHRMNYLGRNRHPLRTTAQLKKLWENTKYRWKVQGAGGNTELVRSDEEISINCDMPSHHDMDSVGFQDVTEAMDHRLNIYQVPEVKTEVERTWELDTNEQPESHENLNEHEPEHHKRNEERRREHVHLYNLKLKEAQMKVALLEKQMQHDAELFLLRKRKLLLEILRLEKEIEK